MKIGFIGAGKVGTTFGLYLKNNGFDVKGYYSRTMASSKAAAKLTGTNYYGSLVELCKDIDILFITTNDDEIGKVIQKLATEKLLRSQQLIIHMSGASSSEILEPAKEFGCYVYSLHPLQSFVDVDIAVKDLKNTVFTIEGDKSKIYILEEILNVLGNQYFIISKEQKSIYHATACVASNYLVTLMEYSIKLFEVIGIEKKEGYRALYPLIEGTIKNIYEYGTEKALTGPISRGDVDTIKNHTESLKKICPENLDFYKVMGMRTIELASKGKLEDIAKLKELEKILKEVE